MEDVKLIKITTKNFKGLGSFEYEPKSEGINIIYGDDGVGKSSLIKIFNFFTVIINNIRLRSAYGMIHPNLSPGLFNPYATFAQKGNNKPIEFEIILEMLDDRFKYGFILNSQNHLVEEYLIKLKKTDLVEKKVIFKKKIYDNFEYDKATFKGLNLSKGELNEENLNSIIALVDFVISNENITTEELLVDLEKSHNPLIAISKAVTILNVANNDGNSFNEEVYFRQIIKLPVIEIHPGDKEMKEYFYSITEEFEEFVMNIDKKIKGIEVKENISQDGRILRLHIVFVVNVNENNVEVPFELMSSGTQDYLKYFKIIYLLKGKSKTIVNNSIILFDEFGIHLHPSLAIKVLNYINELAIKNHSQIFLTSHQAILLDKRLTDLKNKNKNIMIKDVSGNAVIKSLVNTGNKENHFERYIRGYYGGNDLNQLILIEEEDE